MILRNKYMYIAGIIEFVFHVLIKNLSSKLLQQMIVSVYCGRRTMEWRDSEMSHPHKDNTSPMCVTFYFLLIAHKTHMQY